MYIFHRAQDGFSLIEVTIAIGLVAMLMVALFSLSALSVSNAQASRIQGAATKLAQEELELVRAYRDKNNIDALACSP